MSINTSTSPVQISTPLYHYDTCYEVTFAWSNKTYSIAEVWYMIPQVHKQLNHWLSKFDQVDKVVYVTEYTKKLFPHVHSSILCNAPLPIDARHGIAAGLRRTYKDCRITFSQVVSKDAFNDYLEKDLDKNYDKYNIDHKTEYDF